MNVLLLEDEPDLSAVACEQIESRGHTVYAAFDIDQARAIIEDDSIEIDILIADQLVSDGCGSEFAIEIKKHNKNASHISVIVASGQLTDSDIKKLSRSGVEHYIKPVIYSDIVEETISKHFPDS